MNNYLGAAAIILALGGQAMAETTDFDHDIWVAATGAAQEQRGPMIEAAVAQVPVGLSQDQVLEKLGEPDERFTSSWAWLAGETLFGGEYIALLVRFDEAGRVISAKKVNTETWQ